MRGGATPTPTPAHASGGVPAHAASAHGPTAVPGHAGAHTDPATAELDAEVAETTRLWKTVTDEETKQELAKAVKDAQAQREAAAKLGDATDRAAAIKSAKEKLTARKDVLLNKARVGVGMKAVDKKPEEPKDGQFKPKFNVITDQGKFGGGGAIEAEKEHTTKKGEVVNCTASFEGKAWVEVKPTDDYAEKPEFTVSFHLVIGGKAGVGVKKKGEGDGTSGGVHASSSVELELTFSRRLKPEEKDGYIAAVKSANGGGWEELRALQLAAKGSMTEARALAAKLGGKTRAPQEDDESEQKLSSTLEGGADLSAKKGAFGISLSVGTSVSGSLSRKVAFKDGQYWITLRSASSRTADKGAGFALEGVGMSVSKSREEHESRAVTFVIDPAKPELKPLLDKVMAATSIQQMLDLRAANPKAASFDAHTTGDADGGGVGVSAGGLGLAGEDRQFGSETVIDGPDGKTKIYEGGNTSGAHLNVGEKAMGGSTRTDQFTGGAGPDNKGFGETSATDRSGDLMGGMGAIVDKMKKSPLTTAKNLYDGKEELSKEVVHVEGAAFTDDSYGQLAARAKEGDGKWIKYWRGSMSALADWRATRSKIVAAKEDRQKIAQAVAAFERGSGTGRHETVRNAISGTEVAFEFPQSLASKKPYYDKLIVDDPLPAALAAGTPKAVVTKLDELVRQLSGLRDDMSKVQGEFARLDDFQDMAERIDARRNTVLAAAKTAKAKVKAAEDEAAGVNQFTPAAPTQSKVDPEAERERLETAVRHVNELKQSIGDAYRQEQATFAQWEKNLQGEKLLGFLPTGTDEQKLIDRETQLKGLYPHWDKLREQLRQALTEAGQGFDPAEADALKPDRARYRALRKRDPQVGWQRDDGV